MESERKPVLLIGADGMLGRAWRAACDREHMSCEAPELAALDLAKPRVVERLSLGGYSVVINCAAWTDVDGAEANEAEATLVNASGVGALARACARSRVLLVHYSTDYVFSGVAAAPYPVDAQVEPLNAYGRSKALGERLLVEAGGRYLVLRTSWLYAPWAKNFVRTIAALSRKRDALRVVDDQRGRPTSAEHLAATSLALLRKGAEGTFHVTDGGECTWYRLACEVVRLCGSRCAVSPCTTAEFPSPAVRPTYSVLDISRTEAVVGPLGSWQEHVADVVLRLE